MRTAWKFFSSVKLAIALLILLAATLALGTLIPQGESPAFYVTRFGRSAGLLTGLHLTGLFHSVWFLALMSLFAVNTIVCTLARLPAKWRRAFHPQVDAEPARLLAFGVKGRLTRNLPAPEVQAKLEALLASRHYQVMRREAQNRLSLLARKRRLGHFGSDFVHLGLLVVIAGGAVSGLAGFRTRIALEEGQAAPVPRAGIEVRLDKFETEYYPQGNVKAWRSTVTVLENKAPVRTRTIAVNKPLSHRGFSFYQSGYGRNWDNPRLEIAVREKSDPAFSRAVQLNVGERVPLEDKDAIQISVRRFVPDFVIGEGNQVQSRSEEPNNPAALVEAWKGDERVFSRWVFAKYPEFDQMHSGQPTELSFNLTSYHASEYSVIEAARDPGVGWIWAGCLLVTAGFFLAFYWPPREIRVILEPGPDRTTVTAGGQAAKNRESFMAEFEGILDSLRRSS
jgi:cytochrome c biogenesis protein